ncbi:MAG: hypothetical protein COB24_11925 [Hyphomicrobiales bacterium]|nr:MAG: hypothetical protein COB24_11925 [Hyphomicrobiales bacterium]
MTDKVAALSQGVIDYLQRKNLQPEFHWQDVWEQEHAHAFTVAKAMQLDLLEDIRGELIAAEKSGLGFKAFKDNLKPKLVDRGWWGKQTQTDPLTGEIKTVQLGSNRRLKTIYRANIRSARAAGQWERAQRTKKTRPYFIYLLGASEHHREHHVAIAGVVLPVDHAFWDTHFPPNGWNCKCRVRQITQRQAERMGYDASKASPKIQYVEFENKRTGELLKIPNDIDAGWATNAGKARANTLMQHLTGRISAAGDVAGRAVVRQLWQDKTYIKAIAALPNEQSVNVPIAVSGRMAKAFKTDKPVVAISSGLLNFEVNGFDNFTNVQAVLDDGVMAYNSGNNDFSVVLRGGGSLSTIIIEKTSQGFLQIASIYLLSR